MLPGVDGEGWQFCGASGAVSAGGGWWFYQYDAPPDLPRAVHWQILTVRVTACAACSL